MTWMALPLIPALAAVLLALRPRAGRYLPFAASSLVLLLSGWKLGGILGGEVFTYQWNLVGPFSPSLRVDPLSGIFLLVTAFVWWVASLYAPEYMNHEGREGRFTLWLLLTQTAVLGVFLAGDLLTLLLCFELMTITSWFWVIHRGNQEALRAGYFYLFFSIAAGLFVAIGAVLIGQAGGTLTIGLGTLAQLLPNTHVVWGLVAVALGFAVKAGMVPLHLWLPHAHSVAPTPASALLSGILIKAGAYGLLRVGQVVGWDSALLSGTKGLGLCLTVLGAATMLVGVGAALLQSDAKRLLAYHSVSQMGYILLGLGAAWFLGQSGGMALTGAIYHVINHALFKAALFLGVGVVYVRTKETNLYNLGGLWRSFPITAVLMFLAVLGITGAPGLNGYASKTLLHHGISQAAGTGLPLMIWIERCFLLVGVGTAASFAKLYCLMFLRKGKSTGIVRGETWQFSTAMASLAAVMLVIGLRPELVLRRFAIPAARVLGIEQVEGLIMGFSFWSGADVMGMVITLGLGIVVAWLGLTTGAFHWQPPKVLTLEGLMGSILRGLLILGRKAEGVYHSVVGALSGQLRMGARNLWVACQRLDRSGGVTIAGGFLSELSANVGLIVVVLITLLVGYICVELITRGLSVPLVMMK
ncbi:MAG: NADH dehydrogenase [Firmicutes bacterium]|nr:NADH dehydrogenase [Bacillota bacterium]